MANDDVLIVGKLESQELTDSIDKLINEVANKTTVMAEGFKKSMDLMSEAMKDFAVTQKVSVDLIKESWKTMSASFDAMFEAEKSATGGGKGSGKPSYPDNTIGALEQEIALEEKKRKDMQLNSDELRQQNKLIEERKNKLSEQKGMDTMAEDAKKIRKELGDAFSMPAKSLSDAEKKLSQLESIQSKYLGTTKLSTQQQNRLATAIQSCKEKIEKIKQSKPKSIQDVLGMDESSIDAITKKMQALKHITIDPNNKVQVKQLGDEYQRLSRLQSDLLGKNIQHTKSNNYLAQSFGYIRNRIVYALTLGAVTNFTKQVYEIRGQYELLERSLGVLLNSFERGTQVFQELNKMAIESPFTLMELATGAKQLTAYNFAANEVVDTTRRLADISSALGVPMERLVYNLGQIRAQTRLTARDARDFANAGLPIINALAERYSDIEGKVVTTGEVYDRMTKKMVSYNDVMAVLNQMTDAGGKFFEFQAKQAQTLRVQMANLTLAWNNMLNEMGKAHQGLLTLPVSGLKKLLQNWENIDRVLKSLILSFGILKSAQTIFLWGATQMSFKMAAMTVAGARLSSVFIGLGNTMKALFLNPWTWVFVGITAFLDLARQITAAHEKVVELNNEIRANAKEASDSMLNFMNNKGTKATIELAKANKLTTEQGQKAWESVRTQIEQSAMSSDKLIAELLAIDDINERVKKGFDYTEAIQKSQAALVDLQDNDIQITSDTGWWGMFGEGLVSDLKDYAKEVENFKGSYLDFKRIIETSSGDNNPLKINYKEFSKELDETANSINDFIKEHNITDPLQINEILERVRAKIKEKNPEIKGDAAKLFDLELDKKMSVLTNNAVDENASLWSMFMERLKHQSSATFQNVNDDWINSSEQLSKEQQDAIDENLKYFKDSMPYAYEAVAKMVADASKLKIHIGIAFGVQQLSEFQKEVNKRVKEKYGQMGSDQFNALLPTANDNLDSFVKTQQEAIAKLEESNKKYEKDKTDWAKQHIADNNHEIMQRKELLDLFHQSYKKDKKTTSKQKDVLGEALQKEIELIDNIQKRYKEYQKAGVDAQTAIAKATDEYGGTLLRTNTTLNKYGFKTKSSEQLANMDLRSVRDYLNGLLATATALGNAKGIEAIEKAIARINVEITKIDYKHITDSLNNELGKLKDEYDLAIELDANPELGGIFADMFDINIDELPKTAEEYASMYTERLNIAFKKLGANIELPSLVNLTRDDLEEFANMVKENKLNEVVYELIKKGYDATHQALENQTRETVKSWESLLEKYAEYETKLTKIATDAENERKVARRMNAPQWVFDAINNMEKERKAQAAFEKFQKEPEWLIATGDLAGMTDQSLRGLVNTLEDYKKKGNLTAKQTKEINKALVALHKQLRNSNPFHAIADAMDEANLRASVYDVKLEETATAIDGYMSRLSTLSDEEKKKLKELIDQYNRLLNLKERDSKVDASTIVKGINEAISSVSQAIGLFGDLAEAIGGKNMTDAAKSMKEITSIVEKAGQGAQIGASISNSGYGAAIGAVVGGLTQIISITSQWDNERITNQIKESETSVNRLSNAYERLRWEIERTNDVESLASQKAAIANEELQLIHLQYQLKLEKSRKEKDKDYERITEIESEIDELKRKIIEDTEEITNKLLGISSVNDAAEQIVSSMIDAFKNGEDYMLKFSESFDDMIDGLIAKAIVGRVLGDRLQSIFDQVQSYADERASKTMYSYSTWKDYEREEELGKAIKRIEAKILDATNDNEEDRKAFWEKELEKALDAYSQLAIITPSDIEEVRNKANSFKDGIKDDFTAWMDAFGIEFGQASQSKQLSQLQQGISGITETQAGALEAYWNANTQQQYLQSDLLTQIRDAVNLANFDIRLDLVSKMLLQLQNTYVLVESMHTMMGNWETPAGNGIRVQLLS